MAALLRYNMVPTHELQCRACGRAIAGNFSRNISKIKFVHKQINCMCCACACCCVRVFRCLVLWFLLSVPPFMCPLPLCPRHHMFPQCIYAF